MGNRRREEVMAISKLGKRRQVVIPKEICEELGLQEGDFVEVKQIKGSIVIRPKRLVDKDPWDTLTPEEEEEVEEGFRQIEQGQYVTWEELKKQLKI